MKTNRTVTLYGKEDMRLEDRDVDDPRGNEVLLQMGSVGICGSDLKYWKYAKCGRFVMNSPMVIGHEGSGTVIKCGPDVKYLKPGDKVAIEPGVPCRQCYICHSGRYNLCEDMRFCATPPVDGNLCQYYKHPEDFCFKLPDGVTLEQGALVEPLAVALYACERGSVRPGDNVLICGADIDKKRLNFAKDLGADHTIDMREIDKSTEDLAIDIKQLTRVDATIECCGQDSAVALGVHTTRPGGSVVLVGRGSLEPQVPLVKAATFEIDIKGVFRYANCYPKAISMIASGKVKPEIIVSHKYAIEASEEAFECAYNGNAVKVMIQCS